MLSKILHNLSKKASRKNLQNFIELSFKKEFERNRDIKVLNIGSGGDLEDLVKMNFKTQLRVLNFLNQICHRSRKRQAKSLTVIQVVTILTYLK